MSYLRASLIGGSALALVLAIALGAAPVRDVPPFLVDLDAPGAATRPEGVKAAVEPRLVGWLEITGELRDSPPPLAWIDEGSAATSLRTLVKQLQRVAGGKEYLGVVLKLDEAAVSRPQVEELSAAIHAVRRAGKKVLVFSESYDLSTYLLACAADRILLQHKGMVILNGIGVEELYLAGMLEKIGLKADFIQVGKFKGADEMLTRTGPSPEWSQNFDALLDNLHGQTIDTIVQGRQGRGKKGGLDRAGVLKAFGACWSMSDQDYVDYGLVDRLVDRSMIEATEAEFGAAFEWDDELGQGGATVAVGNPFLELQKLFQTTKPVIRRRSIAVISASGPITSGDSGLDMRTGLLGGASIGSRTLVEVLGDAKDNDLVKGVVLRLDSPGGSAQASEVIWQAVRELARDKPVYVSIGGLAASGGYYIACAGREIYADKGSIVGSIGVVGGKLVMGGLYDWAGIKIHRRSRGELGDMFNSVEPFKPQERAALEAAFRRTYEQFTDRVLTGRGKRLKDLSQVAEGRLFSGEQALKHGMIDKIGGLDQAVRDMAGELKLEAGAYDVVDLPGPVSLMEYLERVFGMGLTAPRSARATAVPGKGRAVAAGAGLFDAPEHAAVFAAARQVLGSRAWPQAQAVLRGLMLLQNEPILTLMPTAVVVK